MKNSNKIHYVIWEMGGEKFSTQIKPAHVPDSREIQDWVRAAIRSVYAGNLTINELAEKINMALDTEHPEYCGYSVEAIFFSDSPVQFIW